MVAKDIDVLLERSQNLTTHLRKQKEDYKANDHGGVIPVIDYVIRRIEHDSARVRAVQAQQSHRTRTLNLFEQLLLSLQTLSTELSEFIDQIFKNHQTSPNKDANQLVEYCQKLLVEAKAALAKPGATARKEAQEMNVEIMWVEEYIREIQTGKKRVPAPAQAEFFMMVRALHLQQLTAQIQQQ